MTELERAVLDLEGEWLNRPQPDGAKEQAISGLGLTEVGFYQVLAGLARSPEAWSEHPVVMRVVQQRMHATRPRWQDHRPTDAVSNGRP